MDFFGELRPSMIQDRLKIFACVAALFMPSCGGSNKAAQPSGSNESRPPPVASGGRPGLEDEEVGDTNHPPKRKGALPPAVIQGIVRANFGSFRKCYEDGLRRDPALSGKIAMKFVVERDGTVSKAADIHDASFGVPQTPRLAAARKEELAAPIFPDRQVTECVASKFKELRFPPLEQGERITIVYPIIFSPGD